MPLGDPHFNVRGKVDMLLSAGSVKYDLFSTIINFRLDNIAVAADLEKMYKQILLDPIQRDLQGIVWRDSRDKPMKVFQLTTLSAASYSHSLI